MTTHSRCSRSISQMEANAVFEGASEGSVAQLDLIDDVAAKFLPLDVEHHDEWKDVGLRTRGLGESRSEIDAFNDLMP